jgi:hypothetical protein
MNDDTTIDPVPQSGFSRLAEAIGTRSLLIIIFTMPLVFAAVVAAAIALFGKPGDKSTGRVASHAVRSAPVETLLAPEAAARPIAAEPIAATAPSPFILPAGEDITAMAIDGDRLIMRIKGPSGGSIVVYDLSKRAETQRIRVLENPATDDRDL